MIITRHVSIFMYFNWKWNPLPCIICNTGWAGLKVFVHLSVLETGGKMHTVHWADGFGKVVRPAPMLVVPNHCSLYDIVKSCLATGRRTLKSCLLSYRYLYHSPSYISIEYMVKHLVLILVSFVHLNEWQILYLSFDVFTSKSVQT